MRYLARHRLYISFDTQTISRNALGRAVADAKVYAACGSLPRRRTPVGERRQAKYRAEREYEARKREPWDPIGSLQRMVGGDADRT